MVLEYQATMVKLGAHMGLRHQVLALMLVATGTSFLLLIVVQLSRAEKVY
jgi:ribosomal protein L30E